MSVRKLIIVLIGVVMACSVFAKLNGHEVKSHYQNSDLNYDVSMSSYWKIIKAYINTKRIEAEPKSDIPISLITQEQLLNDKFDAVIRLGHSSLLVRIDGEFILIDPVFSERASPVQWLGPKRFHQSPISLDKLPQLKAVVISHDHYDHLDNNTIKLLDDKTSTFVTPLNVGDYLVKWGISEEKVHQLDWWQEVKLTNLTLVATPAQHFSGRGVFDKDQTLWASWVIQGKESKLFYSGDSGYFSGFKEIGNRYGPFDITMIETGAYNDLWSEIHMLPEESVQAHIDLQGKAMIPVHNSTFDLALHDWYEPLERVNEYSKIKNVNLLTPKFGDSVNVKAPRSNQKWWRVNIAKSQPVLQKN